ncbi:CST complex subunit Ten1 [Diplogelasinospora grovesii]|uniref:CST complex subunit Ten1 n=1 Tax=Diplogelasinospora grovesii TaxID=303347 RepID=A0AAN6NL53_9PEZI|nr:CST complex subunit Ten1 [Diplogelasinospora grovesii]
MSGPLPSQLCLLSALPSRNIGEKVRFLGCVTAYSTASGVLTLEHKHPQDNQSVHALVDVRLLLESLKSEQTRIGEWVNVIGYITAIQPSTDGKRAKHGASEIHIQGLVLWSTGAFDIQRYAATVPMLNVKKEVADDA